MKHLILSLIFLLCATPAFATSRVGFGQTILIKATFNAEGETLVLFGISATRYVVVENIGSVALSASAG